MPTYKECPTCYSSKSPAVKQCGKCKHMYCKNCSGGSNMWGDHKCSKCGSTSGRTWRMSR